MSVALPVIFWIHSPIAFESFLAFQKTYTAGPVYSATARNVYVPGSIFEIGYPGLYQHQTSEQINLSAQMILSGIQQVLASHDGYILAVPQSAQPYIEAMIESPFCHGYVYYDEGAACYEQNFRLKQDPVYHKYHMDKNAGFDALIAFLQVDADKIYKRHRQGVPFYNVRHSKYLGCFSFFNAAFPGQEPSLLPWPDKNLELNQLCSDCIILLASDLLNGLKNASERAIHLKNMAILSDEFEGKLIVKTHPSDREKDVKDLIKSDVLMWSEFCNRHKINSNVEVAFLNFKLYITPKNSTSLYLLQMGKFNVLSIY